eukprot:Rmarinus@m.9943
MTSVPSSNPSPQVPGTPLSVSGNQVIAPQPRRTSLPTVGVMKPPQTEPRLDSAPHGSRTARALLGGGQKGLDEPLLGAPWQSEAPLDPITKLKGLLTMDFFNLVYREESAALRVKEEMEKQLLIFKKERSELVGKIQDERSLRLRAEQAVFRKQEELDAVEHKLKNLRAEILDDRKALRRADREVDIRQNKLNVVKRENNTLSEALDHESTSKVAAQKESKELKRQMKPLQEKNMSLVHALHLAREEKSKVEVAKTKAEEKLSELEKANTELLQAIEEVKETAKSRSEEAGALQHRLLELEENHEILQNEHASALKKITKLQHQNKKTQHVTRKGDEHIRELMQRLRTESETCVDLFDQLAAQDETIAQLRKKFAETKERLNVAEKTILLHDTRNLELTRELKRLRKGVGVMLDKLHRCSVCNLSAPLTIPKVGKGKERPHPVKKGIPIHESPRVRVGNLKPNLDHNTGGQGDVDANEDARLFGVVRQFPNAKCRAIRDDAMVAFRSIRSKTDQWLEEHQASSPQKPASARVSNVAQGTCPPRKQKALSARGPRTRQPRFPHTKPRKNWHEGVEPEVLDPAMLELFDEQISGDCQRLRDQLEGLISSCLGPMDAVLQPDGSGENKQPNVEAQHA